MWTSFEIVVGLGFIILFFVGLMSLARDLLQRNWYPLPSEDGCEEQPRATDAIPHDFDEALRIARPSEDAFVAMSSRGDNCK
jgi:hypothetical protein